MASTPQTPSDVNPAQLQAVQYKDGHLLIVAGPGTGKTHTLICRIRQLTDELKPAQKILAITFTNKAADEMRGRLAVRLKAQIAKITIGTFHSFCLQILRDHIHFTDLLRDFQVASPEGIEDLTKELWRDETPARRKALLAQIDEYKTRPVNEAVPKTVEAYNQFLRLKGLVDFDDLLLESLRLLKENKDVRQEIQETYRFICVDEYQDINAPQHELIKILVGSQDREKVTLTAIGDPNQAIYGFRGSDVRFFENSFARTENNYYVLVYFRDMYHQRADRLVGFGVFNSFTDR